MGLRGFERRLEHLVEGTFARVFKSGLTPLEIGRRITREIDVNQTVGVNGAVLVPNHYWVYVSAADHARFVEVATTLTDELAQAARSHINDEKYQVLGPVSVSLVEAEQYPEGRFQVQAQWREGPRDTAPGALRLSNGMRVELGVPPFTVGRIETSSLVLVDANASRNHAVIELRGSRWTLVDLQSTNGTFVNGSRITEHELLPGDAVVFGSTPATFEAT